MSEAAKPADPERALAPDREAALAILEWRHHNRAQLRGPEAQRLTEMKAGDALGWLLPLARAGLSVPDLTHRVEGLASTLDANNRMLRERREKLDALRAEFAACVRALASIRETARRDYTLALMPDVVADAQRALSGPLAAAVLRSPEPATPADGGA